MTTLEAIIFYFFVFITIFAFILWAWKRKSYKRGQFYDTAEIVTLCTIPKAVVIWFFILLIFFFLEYNKLHLLYIFPIIYFVINYFQAGRILKREDKRKNKL